MSSVAKKSAVFLIALTFVSSLFLSLSMPEEKDGSMSCLFMSGHHMVCPQAALDHLSFWEQCFVAVLFAGLLALAARTFKWLAQPAVARAPLFHEIDFRSLRERNRRLLFHDFLLQNLAQGRLQPKIYERH